MKILIAIIGDRPRLNNNNRGQTTIKNTIKNNRGQTTINGKLKCANTIKNFVPAATRSLNASPVNY